MTLPGHPTTRIYEQRVTLQKNNEEKRVLYGLRYSMTQKHNVI